MSPDVIGVFIPIVAIVMGLGLAMLEAVTQHRRRSQALEQRHRERMAAIEKGIELPPDAGDPEAQLELAKAKKQPRYLLQGLVYTSVGAVLVLAWRGVADELAHGVGWVLGAVGVAQLLYYALEGRKQAMASSPGERPPSAG